MEAAEAGYRYDGFKMSLLSSAAGRYDTDSGVVMTVRLQAITWVLGVFVAVVILGALSGTVGRPVLYEIPGGYKGWLVVRDEDSSCPPLTTRGVFLLVTLDSSGRACTSTALPKGYHYVHFRYAYPNGARDFLSLGSGMNPQGEVWLMGHDPQKNQEFIFVGSEGEMETSGPFPR